MSQKTFEAKTPLGYTVSCTDQTWDHIVTHGHLVMEKNVDALRDAVEDLIYIFESCDYPESRQIFFGRSSTATYGEKFFTKVVVEMPDEYNEKGEIVSAWPEKKIKGGISIGGLRYVKPRLG
ncbi:unknown [Firmicutes bacterium CAG:238]|nr:unknown [Firmicutes bacterium CAG:238]